MIKYITFIFLILSINTQAQEFLRWSDEFNGSTLDTNYWEYQMGDGCPNLCGWGNNELQWYNKEAVTVEDGFLKIKAKKETIQNSSYSSARIRTLNKFDFASGRIEVRARMPQGKGYWPAVWFLPSNNFFGTWPLSGEIDLLEAKGQEPQKMWGTLHYGAYAPNNRYTGDTYNLSNGSFTNQFHVFSLVWKEDTIQWFIDDVLYSTRTKSNLADFWWPFNHNFHFIVNLAVGGYFVGNPDASTPDTATLQLDYIRVYQNLDDVFISGSNALLKQETQKTYYTQAIANASYQWSVPNDATIVSGQNTNSIVVNWGLKSGDIKVLVQHNSNNKTIVKNIEVKPDSCESVVDDAEFNKSIFWVGSTGTFRASTTNPDKDSNNNSNFCNRYYRNGNVTYDVLTLHSDLLKNSKEFEEGLLKLKCKIYTTAPIGTEINLNFENKQRASNDYPQGRRCVLQAKTTTNREWETVTFNLILKPDLNTPQNSINQLIMLFAPNTNSSDVFYFDDFILEETPCKLNTSSKQLPLYNQSFTVYPNPFKNSLNINAMFEPNYYIITDIIGNNYMLFNKLEELNKVLPTLAEGTYILRFGNKQHAVTHKIIKMND